MHRHGFASVFILSAAVLCLFLSGSQSSKEILGPENADLFPVSHGSTGIHPADEADITAGTGVQQPPDISSADKTAAALRCLHYNKNDFMRSVNRVAASKGKSVLNSPAFSVSGNNFRTIPEPDPGTTADIDPGDDNPRGTIMGGIVPHHLLASDMIAAFFADLSQAGPETVIVLGPNHKLTGFSELHTSTADWGTPFGILESDTELVQTVINDAGAAENNTLMENEHSVASLVPYISYYLPDAEIVPLLIHGSCTAEQSEKLGKLLADLINRNPGTVIIASIDFSHYLDVAKADEMDRITLDAVKSWDTGALRLMGSDNLDSVPSLLTLMTAMNEVQATDIEVTGHSNSSYISGSGYEYTTSYFTMFFRSNGHDDNLP